ncbi:hypothetical protein BD309DRAFT_970228 [Dichomitus squalens]|uniref:Uncharacterized protein n=1 Tax=Dichomitus squalens TaxID=114155 RepID=A0A4Q9NJ13_9APHY|nr:hypothetical protein BD309DRAFT_970228 [Dichomitus squalens]TBU52212.1 hypothetical protein BD310DRAFT_940749 [Dichomitus squalens]
MSHVSFRRPVRVRMQAAACNSSIPALAISQVTLCWSVYLVLSLGGTQYEEQQPEFLGVKRRFYITCHVPTRATGKRESQTCYVIIHLFG